MSETVIRNAQRNRFELPLEGGDLAIVTYRAKDGVYVLDHAEVPPAYEGKGVGSRLARGVYDLIRSEGARAMPICSFMAHYANRHPDVADLIVGGDAGA